MRERVLHWSPETPFNNHGKSTEETEVQNVYVTCANSRGWKAGEQGLTSGGRLRLQQFGRGHVV